jgi:outer membrane protein OmpA-like peptidoglycan-associated protein
MGLYSYGQGLTVHFDFNSDQVPDSAMVNILEFMNLANPDSVVLIGHTDSVGSSEYNLALSRRRAKAIEAVITSNPKIGARKVRHLYWYGEGKPLSSNADEEGRWMNRRVELRFIESDTLNKIKVAKKATKAKKFEAKSAKVKKNEVFELPDIQFYPMSHEFMPQSKPSLTELAITMKTRKSMRILVLGHVCCTIVPGQDGDDAALGTNNLSETRAQAVKDYLVSQGIDPSRVEVKGMKGDHKLILDERTEEARLANRRVEFKILEL